MSNINIRDHKRNCLARKVKNLVLKGVYLDMAIGCKSEYKFFLSESSCRGNDDPFHCDPVHFFKYCFFSFIIFLSWLILQCYGCMYRGCHPCHPYNFFFLFFRSSTF